MHSEVPMAYTANCGRKNDIPEQPARRYCTSESGLLGVSAKSILSPPLCPRDPVPRQRSNQVQPLTAPTREEEGKPRYTTGARGSRKGPEARLGRICFDLSRQYHL